MPPKVNKQDAAKASAAVVATDDEGLQALVIADVFDQPGLLPLTLSEPAALVPIAGVPGIEYTLEFLSSHPIIAEVRALT